MYTSVKKALLEVPVRELMVSPVVFVDADWYVSDAAGFFIEKKISGAPVKDSEGKYVGTLTFKDIARYSMWHLEVEEYENDGVLSVKEKLPESFSFDHMTGTTVRQIMTKKIISVNGGTSLKDAARIMLKNKIHRLFIKSRGKIEGIITTMDIVRWLSERDE